MSGNSGIAAQVVNCTAYIFFVLLPSMYVIANKVQKIHRLHYKHVYTFNN